MTTKLLPAIGLAAAMTLSAAQAQRNSTASAQQAFMTKAMQGDLAEIKVGKLAQENGRSAAVKSFGKTLEQDHSANLDQAKNVAQSMNMTPPAAPSAAQQATYDRLSKLKGAAFDKAFARDMVRDHSEDIAQFRSEAKKGGPAADFAQRTIPALEKHLHLARSLPRETTGSK